MCICRAQLPSRSICIPDQNLLGSTEAQYSPAEGQRNTMMTALKILSLGARHRDRHGVETLFMCRKDSGTLRQVNLPHRTQASTKNKIVICEK
jgi:hypothetical protein